MVLLNIRTTFHIKYMSREDFQLIEQETIDNSVTKRDSLTIYHHQTANLNEFDQNIHSIIGEKDNYHQIGKACLQYEMKKEKDVAIAANRVLVNGHAIRLINNAFAYGFKEARLSTTGSLNNEHCKYAGHFFTNYESFNKWRWRFFISFWENWWISSWNWKYFTESSSY